MNIIAIGNYIARSIGIKSDEFIIIVDTTLGDGLNQFTIPTNGVGYDYTIASSDGQVLVGNTGNTTISFAQPGVYKLKISGDFPRIYFANTGDKLKITQVKNWGIIKWTSFGAAFSGCLNLDVTAKDAPDLRLVNEMGGVFQGCLNMVGSSLKKWDVSSIINLNNAFYGNYQAMKFNADISGWNVGNVSGWSQAFRDCYELEFDVSNWDLSAGRNFVYSFLNTKVYGDISSIDIGSANETTGMFSNTPVSGDVSGLDYSRVRQMSRMFETCPNITVSNLSAIDLRRVSNASSSAFANILFSTADVDSALNAWSSQDVAYGAIIDLNTSKSSFKSIEARNKLINTYGWTIQSGGVEENGFVFKVDTTDLGSSNNDQFTIPTNGAGYNYTVKTSEGFQYTGLTGDYTITFQSPGIHTVQITGAFPQIFFGPTSTFNDRRKFFAVHNWGAQVWGSMFQSFGWCQNMTLDALDAPNLSSVTSLSQMFIACNSFNGNLNNWDVSGITSAAYMFQNCINFKNSLSGWDVQSLQQATSIFGGGSGMSRESYEDTLIAWAALPSLQPNLPIPFNTATYAIGFEAEAAKNFLITTYGWTITDGGGVPYAPFTYTIDTTLGTGTDDFTAPIQGTNVKVDTSDGQSFNLTTGGPLTITFPAPGVYTIEISGGLTGHSFNNVGDKLKFLDVVQWGDPRWTYFERMFWGCRNMTMSATDTPDLRLVSSLLLTFRDTTFNTSIDNWDVSRVSTLTSVFYASEYNQPLNSWNVSRVYSLYSSFTGAKFNMPLSNWNTFRLSSLYATFRDNNLFNQDLRNWDVSGVTDVGYAPFRGSPISGNYLEGWDVRTFNTFYGMFEYSSGNPDLSSWDVSYQTPFTNMFAGSNFNSDISSWVVKRALDFSGMFNRNILFNQPIGSWDTSQLRNVSQMFYKNVATLSAFDQDLSGWNVSKLTQASLFLSSTSAAFEVKLSTANYDATLISWGNQDVASNVVISFGRSEYTGAGFVNVAREKLVNDYGWTITDGGANIDNVFVFTVNTSIVQEAIASADNQFTIPFSPSSVINCFVEWGDGTYDVITTWDQPERLHTYPVPGVYEIRMSGDVNGFLRNGDKRKFANISNWGCLVMNSPSGFEGARYMTVSATDGPTLSGNGLRFAFSTAYAFNADVSNWDTSNVTDMVHGFAYITGAVFSPDLRNWDIGNLVRGQDLFISGYENLTTSNYNALLLAWEAQAPVNAVPIGFGDAKYTLGSAAEAARTSLINTYGWTITDGGGIAPALITNLVASYNFDADFTDYTGNNPLTPSGATPPVAGVAGGVVSNCAEFNNTADYTLAADSDDFSFTNGVTDLPFSVSFWANFASYDAGSNGVWFLSKRDTITNEEYQIIVYQNFFNITLFSGGGNANSLNGRLSYPPPIGSWHHYTATYDGSATFAGIKLYIDGASQTLANSSAGTYTGMVNGSQAINIGSRSWQASAGSFHGKLDEYHIWKDRELTAAEVTDVYTTELAGNSILP